MTNLKVGEIVLLNELYYGRLRERFRGEVVKIYENENNKDWWGAPIVSVKRLDLKSQSMQKWTQYYLVKEVQA